MPDRPPRHPDTVAVHAGLPEPEPGQPFLPGPAFASAYHLPGAADSAAFTYNRYGNPTWAAYEQALGALEDAEAVLFASGMAAVSALLLPLGARDVLVLPNDGYPGARAIASEQLAPRGVEVRSVPSEDSAIRAALEGATLLWLETPTNPRLDVCDVASLAAAAREAGAQVVVDNTLATPLAQRPLDLGADVSVSSASKHVTGHSDLLMGCAPGGASRAASRVPSRPGSPTVRCPRSRCAFSERRPTRARSPLSWLRARTWSPSATRAWRAIPPTRSPPAR
jgi:cystathionine gamma-lyase